MTGFTRGNEIVEVRDYDDQYRLRDLVSGDVLDLGYEYDANGNIEQSLDVLDPALDQVFDYDVFDRPVAADAPAIYGIREYDYDAVGNRLLRTVDGIAETYLYEADSNRLTDVLGIESQTYGYDEAGNVTAVGPRTVYGYDDRGRLATVTEGGAEIAAYTYDAGGRRIVKNVGGEQTIFLYDPSGTLLAESASDGTVTREYVYLGTELVAVLEPDGPPPPAPAELLDPAPGSVLGESVVFAWSPRVGAEKFIFQLGSTPGNNDLFSTGSVPLRLSRALASYSARTSSPWASAYAFSEPFPHARRCPSQKRWRSVSLESSDIVAPSLSEDATVDQIGPHRNYGVRVPLTNL